MDELGRYLKQECSVMGVIKETLTDQMLHCENVKARSHMSWDTRGNQGVFCFCVDPYNHAPPKNPYKSVCMCMWVPGWWVGVYMCVFMIWWLRG
jgi:hypothetical protein